MRIAICTDQYLPMLSGLVDSIETLAQELKEHGHEVRIYAPRLPGAVERDHVYYFPGFAVPRSNGGVIFTVPIGAMRDIKKFRPDVIHTQLFGMAGFFAWFVARRLSVRFVGTDHTFPADYLYSLNCAPTRYLVRRFASWFYQRCDMVTTPSQALLNELHLYGLTRPSVVISNPIPRIFRPIENKNAIRARLGIRDNAIAIFGRVAQEKNLDATMDVFVELRKTHNAQLVFIGDGPYRAYLEREATRLGISSDVLFLGIVRDEQLVETLNVCSLQLITSTSENQPMTLLQSMACGLPVVAANAGGLPEYVYNDENGYIVEPTDILGFSRAVASILDNPEQARKFGQHGRKRSESFGPHAIAKQFEAVYIDKVGK